MRDPGPCEWRNLRERERPSARAAAHVPVSAPAPHRWACRPVSRRAGGDAASSMEQCQPAPQQESARAAARGCAASRRGSLSGPRPARRCGSSAISAWRALRAPLQGRPPSRHPSVAPPLRKHCRPTGSNGRPVARAGALALSTARTKSAARRSNVRSARLLLTPACKRFSRALTSPWPEELPGWSMPAGVRASSAESLGSNARTRRRRCTDTGRFTSRSPSRGPPATISVLCRAASRDLGARPLRRARACRSAKQPGSGWAPFAAQHGPPRMPVADQHPPGAGHCNQRLAGLRRRGARADPSCENARPARLAAWTLPVLTGR